MPSGSGKSLCFQLPIVAKGNAFAIVVIPTIAQAKNHINYLKSKDIVAFSWNAHTPNHMKTYIKNNLMSKNRNIKLLYITPEQCDSLHFLMKLIKIDKNILSYFAIDEAHCISPYSHDYRYFYRRVIELHQKHPDIPIIALTATANNQVRNDILKTLKMHQPLIFSMPVFRSNLYYDVWFTDNLPDPFMHLKQFIEESLQSTNILESKVERNCGIVFCKNKETTVSLAQALTLMGIPTLPYHTGLKIQNRFKNQDLWNSGEVNVITATSGFGIGISKQSVRFIAHWHVPTSIGSYYQESGRAGHDGNRSYCRIYYSIDDLSKFRKSLTQKESFFMDDQFGQMYIGNRLKLYNQIRESFLTVQCRHATFAKYFDDLIPICENRCDVCMDEYIIKERVTLFKSLNKFNLIISQILNNFDKQKNLTQSFEQKNNSTKSQKLTLYKQSQSRNNLKMEINQIDNTQNEVFMMPLKKRLTADIQLNKINKLLYIYKSTNGQNTLKTCKVSNSAHNKRDASIKLSYVHYKKNAKLQLEKINSMLYENHDTNISLLN